MRYRSDAMLEPDVPHAPLPLAEAQARADRLLDQADELPTLPDIPARALALMDQEDVSLPEVGDVVALDPVLSARVVRMANSPVFAARGQIESIGAAVVRLGARELRALLLTVSVVEALKPESSGLDLREIWRHTIASGVLGRRLARDLGEPEPDRAYLAGLLHALGDVILAVCFPDRFKSALTRADADASPLDTEFGVSPALCCATLLRHWNIPASIVEAVAFQGAPERAPTHERLARIVATASCACRAFGLYPAPPTQPPRDWRAELPTDLLAEAYGDDPDHYLSTLETLIESLNEILTILVP